MTVKKQPQKTTAEMKNEMHSDVSKLIAFLLFYNYHV